MKKLLVSMICSLFCITLFAQTDSSNTNSTPATTPIMNSDTSQHMNNMNSAGSMNSNSMANNSMPMITTPEPKASLPVLESYIPADVISDIKQKVGNTDQIYDITAVKAPMDSSMMNNNATTAATTNTSTSTDSTNTTQSTTSTTTTTTNNSAVTMNNNSSMSMPQSWDYVVRVIKNGAMTTEKLDASGNPVNQ